MISKRAIPVLCLFAFSASVSAQQRYQGRVEEKADGAPIEGAFVVGLSQGTQKGFAFSGKDGEFTLTLSEGVVIEALRVSMLGYETITLTEQGYYYICISVPGYGQYEGYFVL